MHKAECINITILMDFELVRHGLCRVIHEFEGFQVVWDMSGKRFITFHEDMEFCLPDIFLLDLQDPDGLDISRVLKSKWPDIKLLLFFPSSTPPAMLLYLYRKGIDGFFCKSDSEEKLKEALTALSLGEPYIPAEVASLQGRTGVKKRTKHYNCKEPVFLHDREIIFLRYCCSEMSYAAIASAMNVSLRSVHAYRDALFLRFNVRSRTSLVLYALQIGVSSPFRRSQSAGAG